MSQVYPVIADWRLTEGASETTATKAFVDAPNSADPVTLPSIGDAFDSAFPLVKAVRRTHTYLPGDGTCGKRYNIEYSTSTATPRPPESLEPDPASTDDLVWTVNISPEIRSIEAEGAWKWESDDAALPVDLTLPLRVARVDVEARRVLYASVITPYAVILTDLAGTINGEVWNNFNIRKIMFLGADTFQTQDSLGRDCWDVRLRWTASGIEWDKVLRASTGTYDRPLNGAAALYETRTNAQWALLFTTGKTPPA